jgi:subtilisin family serine protease
MHAALAEYGDLPVMLSILSGPPGAAGQSCDIQPATFGASVTLGGPVWSGALVAMKPTNGCSAATNAAELGGSIALIQRGICYFSDKVMNAQNAGAIATIVYDNVRNGALITMSPTGSSLPTIPACFISYSNGAALVSFLSTAPVSLTFPTGKTASLPGVGIETMDRLEDFSSRGPTLDQRLKPDVVCTGGNIRSALSFGDLPTSSTPPLQCGAGAVVEMSGTSMAAPSCAGASALVRQYFREGFHVAGVRNLSAGVLPSAALIKAVMIHSGRRMYATQGDSFVLPPSMPDRAQGFGRVDLPSVLRFAGDGASFRLSVWDRESVGDGELREYSLEVPAGAGRLRASLVWTDPPSTLIAWQNLVNNLDLSVIGPDGGFAYGNGLTQWDETHGTKPAVDVVNNAEQVMFSR